MKRFLSSILLASAVATVSMAQAKQWTLDDCINYALENNISLKKQSIQRLSSEEDWAQSRAALFPSLSFSTSHNVSYTPWPQDNRSMSVNGYVENSAEKVFYNGSYSLSGNWTVWNGGQNTTQVKQNELAVEQAALDSATTANSIQEQIVQLYTQILYSKEAVNVCRQSLETSQKNEARGKEMVEVGKMSKADLAQLTAQRAQDEYSIVEAEGNVRDFRRQLRQLLQLNQTDEEFDIATPSTTSEMALADIPALQDVYQAAVESRPEIRSAMVGMESSDLSIKMAKAQRMPTVSLNAGLSTNTSSMSERQWGEQLKNNFTVGGGLSVSVPLFDNRQTRTAINKAKLSRENYRLELQQQQTDLYSTIEKYWVQALTAQNKYKAAVVSTQSAQESYDLLSEQFSLGLKNIVELMTGKDNLLQAQQNELQSKYTSILNLQMLDFYRTGQIVK